MITLQRPDFNHMFGVPCDPSSCDGGMTPFTDMTILLSLARVIRPKRVVEFGVCRGHVPKFLFSLCDGIEEYVGIDVPPGFPVAWQQQQGEVPQVAGELVAHDPRFKLMLLDKGTASLVGKEHTLGKFNLVFVDADHSYEGVRRDTAIADEVTDFGGIIAWHDYPSALGVKQFLDERGDHVIHVDDSWMCFEFVR